ncbi:hypothetical protein BC826DRAFT_970123 [Russula brevipes]|nr:hypothetical protein BC826DRAFT_970123 [Russula brevipes]
MPDQKDTARDHALLAGTAFLVVIPLGVLVPRYLRTFTNQWFWAHLIINFLIACPLVFACWGMAVQIDEEDGPLDHHKPIHSAGLVGHNYSCLRAPFLSIAHRSLQNYLHAVLGLAILSMAAYQIHNGLYEEWPDTIGEPVKDSAKHAWLALVIVFWALYGIGLVFLPRQYKQEREGRPQTEDKEAS